MLQKLDVDSIIKETQTLLYDQSNEVLSAAGIEQSSANNKEVISAAGTSRSLSTSSSSGALRDSFRSPDPNALTKINFKDILKTTLDAVRAHFFDPEEQPIKQKDYEVVFLGTGAAIPSKYRNVSSTLINMR